MWFLAVLMTASIISRKNVCWNLSFRPPRVVLSVQTGSIDQIFLSFRGLSLDPILCFLGSHKDPVRHIRST